jgi:hypothetical protein
MQFDHVNIHFFSENDENSPCKHILRLNQIKEIKAELPKKADDMCTNQIFGEAR